MPRRRALTTAELVEGVRDGDRAVLGRAITLVESRLPAHRQQAGELLTALMPHTGGSLRVGLTGVPGAGKSTLIDALGSALTAGGQRVAVLAVDPSSGRTGGSILGDKTRMGRLGVDPMAFIRPSPAAGTLGGVARRTRESLLLCEAAGYEVVIVETVGVGQSETVVADMTDVFVVLLIAGAGDELQGIKRGLMERAAILAVNKADGDNVQRAERAAHELRQAARLLHPSDAAWIPPVLTTSARAATGLDALWEQVLAHRDQAVQSGAFDENRRTQLDRWMWDLVEDGLRERLRADGAAGALLRELEEEVAAGSLAPTTAAERVLRAFLRGDDGSA